ncbi:hypothetical protein C1X64_21080 [Pseudomonas sp. GW456-E7]|nr:hypothetical protein C1X64_21080 [Pseudomonas sp. GW456-E7]
MADGGGLCRSELAPGGVPTKNLRAPRDVRLPAASLTSIASNRASTGCSYRREKGKKKPSICRPVQQLNWFLPVICSF